MRRFQLKLGICFVAIYYEITWMRSWCQGWPLNNNQKRMLEHVKGEVRRGQVYCLVPPGGMLVKRAAF